MIAISFSLFRDLFYFWIWINREESEERDSVWCVLLCAMRGMGKERMGFCMAAHSNKPHTHTRYNGPTISSGASRQLAPAFQRASDWYFAAEIPLPYYSMNADDVRCKTNWARLACRGNSFVRRKRMAGDDAMPIIISQIKSSCDTSPNVCSIRL